MKVETALLAPTIQAYAEQARRIEDAGYDSVITPEAGHDPFLPLMVIAEHTKRLKFGTGVAIAFPRSPMVTAQIAWDLQRYSGGRFILGLGTQVKGHNERRYSTPWPSPPGPRLREYILCMKAIFRTFQTGARPEYKGQHYEFSLISPFFNPGANEDGRVPIYISAVNKFNCRLVGELCDGIRMHRFSTPSTRRGDHPGHRRSAKKAGRDLSEIDIVAAASLLRERTRRRWRRQGARAPAGWRSTPRRVSTTRCWKCTAGGTWANGSSASPWRQVWPEMGAMITDEMLEEFAIIGTYDQVVPRIKQRYQGVVTTLDFGFGVRTPEQAEALADLVQEIKQA
jgi:probable F420-dependent oxidoreductase